MIFDDNKVYQLYGVGGEGGVEPAQGVQELNRLPHLGI